MGILTENAYVRLMRLHQPIGIWLLLWPCWWAVALASPDFPDVALLAWFAIGAVVMRSAGCIINDIADRDFDRQVERTKTRPLASGELSLRQAGILLALLLLLAFIIAWQLGMQVVWWSVLALPLVAAYPLMKRITWWPQVFLGITFNWGALLGWVAVHGSVGLPAVLLYVGGVFWTLGYDTIYAHQDKTDDARIGVRSTALRLGKHSKSAVTACYVIAVLFWVAAGWMVAAQVAYFITLLLVLLHLLHQICTVDIDNPMSCKRIFASNRWVGAGVFVAAMFA